VGIVFRDPVFWRARLRATIRSLRCWNKLVSLVPVMVSMLAGCQTQRAARGCVYVVDMRDSRWTLVHTDHTRHQQVRYVVTCNWYKWAEHEKVPGDCNLPVGKILVWNGMPDEPSNFVDIDGVGDILFITEGGR
jgi:hypothetical protein